MAAVKTKGQVRSKETKSTEKTPRKTVKENQGTTSHRKKVIPLKLTPPPPVEKNELDKARLKNAELILARMQADEEPIYTCDIETDPFARGEVPVPFIIGLYDGLTFWHFSTDKHKTCVQKLREALEDGLIEPGIIYMHNGGRFDFFYLLDFFEGRSTIVNSRIISALMPIGSGTNRFEKHHRFEWRDSFAIMPFALKEYEKEKIDIQWLSRKLRDAHMGEIISYLKQDCVGLWDLCMGFQVEFGDHKTIASAAFSELAKFHNYTAMPWRMDKELREAYYFGGRVQCFASGVIEKPVNIYDVNSMYPFVMSTYLHPTGWSMTVDNKIHGWKDDGTPNKEALKTFFVTAEGENLGAFPTRAEDGSVDFTISKGVFHVSIHEWLAAIQLGLFKPRRILSAHGFLEYSKFATFVDHFYKAREKAKATGDKMHSLFYKFILNSAYGKFGINPANYFNWKITKTDDERPKGEGWTLENISHARYFIWKQPSQLFWNVKNIGTAASITGAARSVLMRAIAGAKDVLYCDTDSLICGEAGDESTMPMDDKRLGAWKHEGSGVVTAIAGKKTYAVFDSQMECVKHACKGVNITPDEILRVANGEEVLTFRDAPTFKRDGSAVFISRKVRNTA